MVNQYLLLITHMRSRSSLLSHILGSHPEISGYAEMKVNYLSINDLQTLREKVIESLDDPNLNRILVDKLVDLKQIVTREVLNHNDVRIVFLLRHPKPTLASLMELSSPRLPHLHDRMPFVIQYYLQRTAQIRNYASQLSRESLFIESDQLIDHTENVFLQLQKFLGLHTPLRSEYKVFKLTGISGFGDTSANLQTGKLINTAGKQLPVALDPKIELLLQRAYDQSCEQLRQICTIIEDD
jgi:hypothetical protein